MRKITLVLFIVLSILYVKAGIYYVTLNGAGTKDGSSWANANAGEAGIAAGITASASAGGDIWVAAGTYTHSTTMTITDKVNIYGGFAGTESDKGQRTKGTKAWDYTNATILSGGTTQVFTLAGNLATGAIIDGFTFTGNTSTTQGSIAQTRGNVTIQNCIFSGNTTSAANGATVNMLGGTLSYCYIYNNTATAAVAGGGIPGGIYANPSTGVTTTIDHCLIDKNTGGGLRCQGTAMTYVNACTFRRNLSVTTNGGATLANGGAVYTNSGNNRFTNCLIYNNSGANVIYANGGEFTNNTICNNEGQFRFANTTGSNVEKAHNNIVWGNLATVGGAAVGFSVAAATGGTNTVQNNLVSVAVGTAPTGATYTANVLTATDNTGVLFASPTASVGCNVSDAVVNAADWHINSGSGAINIGNNSLIPSGITTDFAGNNRTYNTTVDAGAYEYQWVSTPVTVTNNGFEDALANFTISESGTNMLYRVNGTWATTTTTGNPTASSVSVTNGLWVKRALNTTYIKAIVVSSDVHGGSNSLNLAINSGSASTGLDTWSNILAQQKISLSNTEKYTISFWAKVDAASSNSATKVVVFVTDNTLKSLLSCAIPLTGGTTWTQYSATFDIPTFKAANSTADFTNAYIGVGLPATYDATSLKTNYSGVLLDDFSVNTANTGTVVVTTAAGANGNVTGSGTVYVAGSTATVVATPNSGYTFTGWSDGASTVSTNPTYTFTANSNVSLTASFAATTLTTLGTLNSFNAVYGTASSEQLFTVAGTNLVSNIVITPPTGFEISTVSGSGYQSTALVVTPTSGTVNTTTIYVRIKATASATSYSTNITVAALGMTTQNIACSGTVSPAPLTITGISVANKVYDGTNAASITGTAAYSGLVNGETPSMAGTPVATFADETIGNGKTVTVSGYAAPTSNYSITQPTGFSANIYPVTSTFSNNGTSNWSSATDWTYSPISSTNLVVSSGELIVDQDATVNSVTVSPGAKLTLSAGKTLTTGTVTLNSDATGTATFVDNGNSTVNAVVNQYLTAGRNWYISVPVTSVDSSAMSSATAIMCYSEPTASWVSPATATLSPLKGYISTTTKTTAAISFAGTLNTGNQSIVLTRTASVAKSGFNLLGNPYPSYLDWSLASAANPGVMSTIWYRTKTATAYTFDTYNAVGNMHTNNGLTTVSNLIPPMQAFWVRVNEGQPTATVTFTNAMRSHADVSGNKMKAPALLQTAQQVLRLQVSNGINSDETIVLFNSAATNSIDDFDSPKMTNNNAAIPELYTVSGNQQLVINGLNSITPNEEIPLGFTTGQSNVFTLKATELSNFDSGMQILLKDNLLNSEQLLAVGTDYSFTSDITSNTSRFTLIFKSPSLTTALNDVESLNEVFVNVDKDHRISIRYSGKAESTDCAEIYNSVGQQLYKQPLNSSVTLLGQQLKAGVYVVVINVHGERKVEKVTVN